MTVINPGSEILHNPESSKYPEFTLRLEGHELVDPETNRGHVVAVERAESLKDADGKHVCDVFEVEVEDPFVNADPVGYKIVNEYISRMEDRLLKDGYNPLVGLRSEATSREERNPYTQAWTAGESAIGVSLWRDLVPTGEALEYLTNPVTGREIMNRNGDTGIVSPETAIQLRFTDDGVAIRDRAVVSEALIGNFLGQQAESSEVRMVSLASGTAEPAIAAAKSAEIQAAEEGKQLKVDLTVADYDPKSLKFVRKNAERYDFDSNVSTVVQNILTPNLKEELEEATGSSELYDVVENLGFEEYLPQEGDELTAFKGNGLPQASEFTKNAFELVKPGGVLISGNMILDRPQLGFVFGIVDWPIINARSEESIMRVYKEAGIIDDPNAKVEMYRVRNSQTGSHVYNIVKVTKLK